MKYSANDNLEVMKCAKNYNNFIIGHVFKAIEKNNCKNILDFGCADGFFIRKILDKFENVNTFGVEIDDFSFKKCKDSGINVARSIDEFEAKFDIIYSFNTLEHIEDDFKTLQDLYNKLNSGGKLILYVPALPFLYSSMDKKTGHYRRYRKKDLSEKLIKAGFNIEKIEYCDCIGVIATLLYILKDCVFKSNNGDISEFSVKLYDKIFPLSQFLDKLIFKYFLGKNLVVVVGK